MDPIQTAVNSTGVWDVLLYFVWPAIIGAYGFTWKLNSLALDAAKEVRTDIKDLRRDILNLATNDLAHLTQRVQDLESELRHDNKSQ